MVSAANAKEAQAAQRKRGRVELMGVLHPIADAETFESKQKAACGI